MLSSFIRLAMSSMRVYPASLSSATVLLILMLKSFAEAVAALTPSGWASVLMFGLPKVCPFFLRRATVALTLAPIAMDSLAAAAKRTDRTIRLGSMFPREAKRSWGMTSLIRPKALILRDSRSHR